MKRQDAPPKVSGWFQDGFHRFLRRYLRKNFHAIAVHRQQASFDIGTETPLMVYGNHPSWWDPMIAHFLNRTLMVGRQFYAPIDHAALQKYRVLGKLGFYGVDLESNRGAAEFLQRSMSIISSPGTAIWLTPEGRFVDARDHGQPLMPGLAHLCKKADSGHAIPLALEYVFWDEKLPVCLAKFGEPIALAGFQERDKATWNEVLTTAFRTNQLELAEDSKARSAEPFENLLKGKRGAGSFYDSFRRAKSVASGKQFRASHGDQFE